MTNIYGINILNKDRVDSKAPMMLNWRFKVNASLGERNKHNGMYDSKIILTGLIHFYTHQNESACAMKIIDTGGAGDIMGIIPDSGADTNISY